MSWSAPSTSRPVAPLVAGCAAGVPVLTASGAAAVPYVPLHDSYSSGLGAGSSTPSTWLM